MFWLNLLQLSVASPILFNPNDNFGSAYAAAFPPINPTPAALYRQCSRPGLFALTFDDGPSQYTTDLLATLARNNVKATFFVNGHNVADLTQQPWIDILKQTAAAGHEIGSHTLSHSDMTTLTDDQLWSELSRNDDLIFNAIGKRPTYVRPPYGSYNDHVLNALGSWGYTAIVWNLDTKDYDPKQGIFRPTRDQISQYQTDIGNCNPETDSFIALHHDTVRDTAETMAQYIIDYVRRKGYRLVTVSECLGQSAPYR